MLPRRLHGARSSRPGTEPRTTTYRTAHPRPCAAARADFSSRRPFSGGLPASDQTPSPSNRMVDK